MIITDPIRVLRVGSLAATTRSRIEVIFPGALTEFNDLFLAIVDAGALIKGLGIVLVGVVNNDPEVRVVQKAHEKGGYDTS
jgi:hypothetical protein